MAEKNVEPDNRAPPMVERVPGAPGQTRVVETGDSARQGPKGLPVLWILVASLILAAAAGAVLVLWGGRI